MLTTEDFDFVLPENLIAQVPLKDRSSSRLLVMDRQTGAISDQHFPYILDCLKPGDALVINDTRVLPARLHGIKPATKGHLEVLLLHQEEGDDWQVLIKPAKRAKVGTEIVFGDGQLTCQVIKELDQGGRVVRFAYQGVFLEVLSQLGEMPLPPYIKVRLDEQERYQTVYSKVEGSAAAPTAGLHFTPSLLAAIKAKGVTIVPVTLHVGLGTFRPVSVSQLADHQMHAEFYQLSQESADLLAKTKREGGRIVAVGTTSVRVLETVGQRHAGQFVASSGWTDIFISPGYRFQMIDGLLTNFHLPKSTLVMLVSAFSQREYILQAYQHAIAEQYRFFSFGDAMLII